MMTFLPIDKITTFEKDFKTNQYPNIIVGTEGLGFFVKNYYRIADMPFIATNGTFPSLPKPDVLFLSTTALPEKI